MLKGLFGLGKGKKKNDEGASAGQPKVRRTIPLPGLDERERSVFAGFQMLSASVADPNSTSTEDIVHFYREARICGKTEEAMRWMMEFLPQRPGEDYHSERRQVLAECVASLMGEDEDYSKNLNQALDRGGEDPNQAMIEHATDALTLVAILGERRCAESLSYFNPLGKTEHDLWFEALSRVPDDRCILALLAVLKRGRLFVEDCAKAIVAALHHYGGNMDPAVLRQLAEVDGISFRALKKDGSFSEPQLLDCTEIKRLALGQLASRRS